MRYPTLSPLLRRRRAGAAFLVLASLLQGGSALAGDHRRMPVDPLPEYVQECGACHVAYPPALLPRLRTWVTSEYEHNGLRAGGEHVLDHLLDLAAGLRAA